MSECESMNALCRRVVRRQMEESNEHPLVSSRIPYEYATHIRTQDNIMTTIILCSRGSYYKHLWKEKAPHSNLPRYLNVVHVATSWFRRSVSCW